MVPVVPAVAQLVVHAVHHRYSMLQLRPTVEEEGMLVDEAPRS